MNIHIKASRHSLSQSPGVGRERSGFNNVGFGQYFEEGCNVSTVSTDGH